MHAGTVKPLRVLRRRRRFYNLIISPDIYKHPPAFDFFQPVVVLDGLLCAATLSQNGEVEISEIPAAAFKFDLKTEYYGSVGGYRVDLVTLSWLPDYIKLCEQRHNDIYHEILKAGNVVIDNSI